MERIAIIGTGLIGRSWAMVFARAGHPVRIWDAEPRASAAALGIIGERLGDLAAAGLLADAPGTVAARITAAASMAECLEGAVYVQENGPERLEPKRALFAAMDALCGPDVILASSTSGIPASAFTEALPGRARCLVAHPVNPPYLVPLVELVGAPWTAPEVIARARTLMDSVQQVPVVAHPVNPPYLVPLVELVGAPWTAPEVIARARTLMDSVRQVAVVAHKETRGFVLNRLQAALVAEAFRLVRDGVMSVEDVDACVKHGLGLRWAFMGPFETCDLNAPGGIPDYAERYGPLLSQLTSEMPAYDFDAATVARVAAERRALVPAAGLADRAAWRDRELMALVAHKARRLSPEAPG